MNDGFLVYFFSGSIVFVLNIQMNRFLLRIILRKDMAKKVVVEVVVHTFARCMLLTHFAYN